MFLEKNKETIKSRFNLLFETLPLTIGKTIADTITAVNEETALALQYLYTAMPFSDIANYGADTFLDYARHGVKLYHECSYIQKMPEELYLNYVLYHRVNEEEIAPCRSLFYDCLGERVSGKSMKEAALLVNYWCAEEASYHQNDNRTAAPYTVYRSGWGRCGEESAFTVSALRSVGIPARQVYTPKWSHCDDNHAWVEACCDGVWYFMGACEPEPILNKGWFTQAASRAMLIHSRGFDDLALEGELIIGTEGMNIMENQLGRYAKTVRVEVAVADQEGQPAGDAAVRFEVLNDAELSSIAELTTGEDGNAELVTGLGNLHIAVSKGEMAAFKVIDTRNTTQIKLTLAPHKITAEWEDFEMEAPKDTVIYPDMLSKEEKKRASALAKAAADKRLDKLQKMPASRFTEFKSATAKYAGLGNDILEVLSDKDQLDASDEVLLEHILYAGEYRKTVPDEVFKHYILNPRIQDEVLTSYRAYLTARFSETEKISFRNSPDMIFSYIEKAVKSHPDRERASLITTPAGCLELGIASELSKKVLFVAIARTIGIPARLNPVDNAMEYWQKDAFVPVIARAVKNAQLQLCSEKDMTWTYHQNFTVAKWSKGSYQTLRLGKTVWEKGYFLADLEQGVYRILTANRLPNGNISAKKYEFSIREGETKKVNLSFGEADLRDMLVEIPLPEFTLCTHDGGTESFMDIVAGQLTVFFFLEEGMEPTEHILNELMEHKKEILELGMHLVFVLRSGEALTDRTLAQCLDSLCDIRLYYDEFDGLINTLARRVYADPDKLPLIIVADSGGNGIYAASGYNVGTASMLLRIIQTLERV